LAAKREGKMGDIALADMRYVLWGPTFKLAGLRSVASALVLTAVGLVGGWFEGLGQAIGFLLLWSIGASIGGVANIYMLKAISTLLAPIAGGIVTTVCTIMSFIIALMLACGDPLVYLLLRKVPGLVDTPEFGPFNLRAIIFVLDENAPSVASRA
jgi:hypothetical protein